MVSAGFITGVVAVLLALWSTCVAGFVNYNTGASVVEGKLNVHLVPHSHDDVGWLKTIDQYYVGLNNTIQDACIENVLDSVVESLLRNPDRKFVFAEQAFFQRWWGEQNEHIQMAVKKLVETGQLEFVNGGWCMHDEATTHYIDMIDQTTLGHRMIKQQFNAIPRSGWQIDPFGHSSVQAYLLGSELGFDSLHFWRMDYEDREKRYNDKSLEVIWRGSKTFGSTAQIFTNIFPVNYAPPPGFHFEVKDENYLPLQDNPLLFDMNIENRVNDLITAAISQANITRTNHIMWAMGDDFVYQYAETWFKQMDKLIHYVNKDGRINALYSTASIYTDAKNAENETWPLKTDDFFPYAERAHSYWTGYFTSRPSFKRYVRDLSGYYLAARQLEFLAGRKSDGPNSFSLGDALGIAQHHDAITGTAKQHVNDDYTKRLFIGASEAQVVTNVALSRLIKSSQQSAIPDVKFSQCPLLNISYCPPTEEQIQKGKSLVVVAYNSLGWSRANIVRIPVNNPNLLVKDSKGNTIESQYVEMDKVTKNLRRNYTELYLGISVNKQETPKYWLLFLASVPPLGWNTYFISNKDEVQSGHRRRMDLNKSNTQNETVEVGPGNLKMSFSLKTGQLKSMLNSKTGVNVPMQQNYLWYASSSGDERDSQASGTYVFRPNNSSPFPVSKPVSHLQSVPMKIVRGPLVHEVHQQFSSWVYQVTRLYKDKDHAEVEFTVGPIQAYDGMEVITRITTSMATKKMFYTDSNGRDFLQRVRDYRKDWSLSVYEPVAGNYYPLNLGMYIADNKTEFSVLVDRATGGASIHDGELELMLHRRLQYDDGKGVGEPLDEVVCFNETNCEPLTIRGNYYININKLGTGQRWRRTTGQEVYSPLLLAFTHESIENWNASHVTKATTMDPSYVLPPNVALITLQELDDGAVLVRLAHLYEIHEDTEYSTMAKVELKKLFGNRMIKELNETSLSTNQKKSEMKMKMKWTLDSDGSDNGQPEAVATRGAPVDKSTLVVELGPMEIRTFLIKF
ncbi:alpha-mannosidase-like [Papaver somniferum]|uniref:alpha-mannosidase-like n=1 Tax=Papaver somniferum TaxID=3469 RepID=UPI000E703EDC|nr:alpha-mannosidase-like [Papaver somniferum]